MAEHGLATRPKSRADATRAGRETRPDGGHGAREAVAVARALFGGTPADGGELAPSLLDLDLATRIRTIDRLQRTRGNAAVQRLLVRCARRSRTAALLVQREQPATQPATPQPRYRKHEPSAEEEMLVKAEKAERDGEGRVITPGRTEIRKAPAVYVRKILQGAGYGKRDEVERYLGEFLDVEFLGQKMSYRVHRSLVAPLREAEKALGAEAEKKLKKKLTPAEIGVEMGISGEKIAGGRRAPTGAPYSMHLFGLALDLNYTRNPHIGEGRKVIVPSREAPVEIAAVTDAVLRNAGELVTGKKASFRQRAPRPTTRDADTMAAYDALAATNATLTTYFSYLDDIDALRELLLAEDAHPRWRIRPGSKRATDRAVRQRLARIRSDLRDLAAAWKEGSGRRTSAVIKETGFMNLRRELVEALVAKGFDWGGSYGDIMHFDLRHADPGDKIHASISRYERARKREARAEWLAAEQKRVEAEKRRKAAAKAATPAGPGSAP